MAAVRVVIFNDRGEVCCVRHAYGAQDWNVPGGTVEQDESLLAAAPRETLEETGLAVHIQALVGLYSIPATSDLIAVFTATIKKQYSWMPNSEIADVIFVAPTALPTPMHPCVVRGLWDALDGRRGLVRVLNPDGTVQETLEQAPS